MVLVRGELAGPVQRFKIPFVFMYSSDSTKAVQNTYSLVPRLHFPAFLAPRTWCDREELGSGATNTVIVIL